MYLGKKLIIVILSLTILIANISTTAEARTIYVIADTGNFEWDIPKIQAYRIQDSNLVYQADYNCVHPLAIGLAIDTDSKILFDRIRFSGIIKYNEVGAVQKVKTQFKRAKSWLKGRY